MVMVKQSPPLFDDGSINIDAWLSTVANEIPKDKLRVIQQACVLAQIAGSEHPSYSGKSCLQQGLEMADILVDLSLDYETIAAAIVYDCVLYADLSVEDVAENLGDNVAKIVVGSERMSAVHALHQHDHVQPPNPSQMDNIRKMILAMVDDVRVILLKLAERTCILRAVEFLGKVEQQRVVQETRDIYAPLANRLGIGQIKWEMEDLTFRYTEPDTYKGIAAELGERRMERMEYVNNLLTELRDALKKQDVHVDIEGRAKHIFSIHRKMCRKDLPFSEIYDTTALRILSPTIEDCYKSLAIVHELWEQIPQEFDDYIATPKPNGYRSIHTAVKGPGNKNVEIQIRTLDMHQESEHGVAAHWRYKEGASIKHTGHEAKIALLRQVIEWQRELSGSSGELDVTPLEFLDDRVYVFTPTGEVVDLPKDSTPLDFAYHIHSEIGHRCRGAKINNHMVTLTHQLSTGDQVEILTTRHGAPSRDWINPHLGYLKTTRAKAKVHNWFRRQDHDKNSVEGHAMLERECRRLGIPTVDCSKLANKFNFKTGSDLLAAIGCGDVRVTQVITSAQALRANEAPQAEEQITLPKFMRQARSPVHGHVTIFGVDNLLSHIAKCCQPVPGDAIVGFITQGKGVSVHRQDCPNILRADQIHKERLIEVQWREELSAMYPVTIRISANDEKHLQRDITAIMANEKINLTDFSKQTTPSENRVVVKVDLVINTLEQLSRVLERINQLPGILEVRRV